MTKPSILKSTNEKPAYLTGQRFDQFDLRPELLKGVAKAGFDYCTEIQAETLPLLLSGTNIAGQAHTGTGKTAAFLLAIYQTLLTDTPAVSQAKNYIRSVVLAPTRELAIQIHHDAEILGAYTDLRLGLVYGGTDYQKQRTDLAKGVDILIGTPGRLIDYFKQNVFDLSRVEVVVLDEADRMFDLGFIKDIRYILRRMPPPQRRLNMLFSATLSYRIKELAYEHMNDPCTVTIASKTPVADRLVEQIYYPANSEKFSLLLGVIDKSRGERMLIFANTRHTCDRLGHWLSQHNYSTGVLSGDVPQKKRENLLLQFKQSEKQILVATDVAARGLHIPHVSHVFNYDLPQDPEDYVHRIGRTARAGESGYAISFACEEHALSLIDIESYIGHPLEKMEISEDLLYPSKIDGKSPLRPKRFTRETKTNTKKKGNHRSQKNYRVSDSKRGGGQITAPEPDNKNDADHHNISRNQKLRPDNQEKTDSASTRQINQDIPAIG